MEVTSQKSIENLQLAWRCVLDPLSGYRDMMVKNSMEQGPGLHIFKFDSPKMKIHDRCHNCEYYFLEKDSELYKKIMETVSNKKLLSIYDPYKHYEVYVSVPRFDLGDERVQSIRLFSFDNHQEVEL